MFTKFIYQFESNKGFELVQDRFGTYLIKTIDCYKAVYLTFDQIDLELREKLKNELQNNEPNLYEEIFGADWLA